MIETIFNYDTIENMIETIKRALADHPEKESLRERLCWLEELKEKGISSSLRYERTKLR